MTETNFKHTDLGLIPHDWEVKTLGEICDVRDGTHDSPKYVKSGYPLVTSKNLTNGVIDFANIQYISKVDYDKINERSKADIGDVLYAMIGTIGNPVLITKEPNFAIKNVALFKDIKKVCQAYIRYFFDSTYTIKRIMEDASGSNQKFIPLGYFRNMPIPFPPTLAEQERIAGALSSIDTLIGALTEQIEKKRHIKQGTIQTLFRESNKWERNAFGDILRPIPKGTLKTTDLKPTGYPVINSGKTLYGYYDNYNNEGEAITIAARGEYAGWISYFNEKFWAGGLCYPYSVKDKNSLNTQFLYYALKQVEGDIMENLVARGSIPALNKSDLEQFIILVPPTIEEQASIANTLSSMDDSIAALEQKRDKYIAIKSGMMQNLLTGKIRLV